MMRTPDLCRLRSLTSELYEDWDSNAALLLDAGLLLYDVLNALGATPVEQRIVLGNELYTRVRHIAKNPLDIEISNTPERTNDPGHLEALDEGK